MKRFAMLLVCLLILTTAQVYAARQDPSYAKWGKLAVLTTKEKYPQLDIIDYLYVGREKLAADIAVEKFKFWVRDGEREYGLFIDIELQLPDEQVRRITFRESPI
ncbi:YqzG/YhdC family protein [Ectobacillus sp. JY-23]|uniref:DUF3889 domain-containing protein n=1 Tax=Ectobacillus sp. JY-23 TaxID=2933872 RepID=UPI001FF22516|nr:DUF3889 domain-containing protein [Ectobacillus sp. JY-23]UOY93070.1 YqzG/YhdC family protein [Ectobacillus sp. JY-23]